MTNWRRMWRVPPLAVAVLAVLPWAGVDASIPTEPTVPPTTVVEPATTTVPATTSVPAITTVPSPTLPPEPTTTAAPETTTAPASTTTTEPPIVALIAPTLGVQKSNNLGGEPAEPGDEFEYNFSLSCSSIDEDCQDFVFSDIIPGGLEVDTSSLPNDTATRDVSYDPVTRELRIEFTEPIDNPVGVGWLAGSNMTFDLTVRVPIETDLVTGDVLSNTATVTATNGDPATATSDVTINIPRVVNPVTTKSFTDGSGIAGSGESTTIRLGVRNGSSTSAEVDELRVEDTTVATFEHLNFVGATVTAFPEGADTLRLSVCTLPSGCPNELDWIVGTTTTSTTPPLPPGVTPEQVTGVRVGFVSSTGADLPRSTQAGSVDVVMELRDTFRSSGLPLLPTNVIDISNCAASDAADSVLGRVEGGAACAPYRVIPDTLVLTASKSMFADTNGDGDRDAGEFAVIGENSPVTAQVRVNNTSPFPISEIVITEPAGTAGNEFSKIDVETIRLTFPAGATSANVVVNYSNGSSTDNDYASGGAAIPVGQAGATVTSIVVTYTGTDGAGEPTIGAGATAGLDLHGPLNAGVTNDDLPTGTSPGVVNCAGVEGDAGRGDGTGTYAGTACTTMPVELPRSSATGVKTVSQTNVPEGQPISFVLRVTNNGNVPLIDPTVADPPTLPDGTPDPSRPNPFDSLQLVSASVTPTSGIAPVVIEIYVAGAWVTYTPALASQAEGVRARMTGELNPTQAFNLNLVTQRRAGIADGVPILNCFGVTAGGDYTPVDPWCSPEITTGDAASGATLNKSITPTELPVFVPGLPQQTAAVQVRTRNTGNLSARTMQIIEDDADFFDAFNFVSFGSVQAPGGANRITVDAFVGGAWVAGLPTPTGSPSLPAGVAVANVRGLRFTFSSTSTANDGFVIPPCTATSCDGVVNFNVAARTALASDPETAPPLGDYVNTIGGNFVTRLDSPGSSTPIPPNSATIELVEGSPRIDVNKGPEAQTIAPGDLATFNLTVTNNGTANLPDLVVVDPIPAGLEFDDTFAGDGGQPFTATATGLPADFPPLPAAVFEQNPDPVDPSRVGQLRWSFPDWDLPPGATVTITIRARLAPGVTAGQVISNTMAAGSTVEGLACTPPDPTSTDGTYGPGTFCTDSAQVTARAGASFSARKWVAGDPSLGWWSPRAGGEIVPTGGGGCPVLNVGGVLYTSNPCIALVNPGDPFDYVLRVTNAGTEPATRMRLIDRLPVAGDTGVLGAPRGTEWDNRPTIATAPVVTGPGTATVTYTTGAICNADLTLNGPGCPAGSWSPGFTTAATGFQVDVGFATPLPPGQGITIAFGMTAPPEITHVSDPTIAWNSFAHAEATQMGSGSERILPPIEPIKVGIATFYGDLELEKLIGENPAGLPVEGLAYTFSYECTVSGTVVTDGDIDVTPGTPSTVADISAGAECSVWETGTNGGIPTATETDPVVVTIEAGTPQQPAVVTAAITNDFPMTTFTVAKTVSGDVLDVFTGGPFAVTVDCSYLDTSLPGFPVDIELTDGNSEQYDVPVGATCTSVETDNAGAHSVTYDPAAAGGDAGSVVLTADATTNDIEVTNDYLDGALVILKDVTGAGVPGFSDGPFTFDVVCDFDDDVAVFSTTVTLDGSTDGSPVTSEPIIGLPIGAVCTVTETDNGGADTTPSPVTVTIAEGAEPTAATFVNPFTAGTISVTKTVDGDAADSDYVAGLTYTMLVECVLIDGEETIPVWSGELDVTAGGTTIATTDGTTPVLLPLGTSCWGTETSSGGATSVSVDFDSIDNATAVSAAEDPAVPQALVVGVTNTFERAQLTVSKTAVNARPGLSFDFEVTCSIDDIDGGPLEVPVLSGDTPFTLASGESATFDVLAGSTCTIVEVDAPADATVTIADSEGDPADGTVIVDDAASVEFTNTFETAALTVSKTVVNGRPGVDYQFEVSCTIEDASGETVDAPLVSGGSPFTLSDSESTTLEVLADSTCRVAELDAPEGADVTVVDSDGDPSDGVVHLVDAANLDVTNTFEPAELTVSKIAVNGQPGAEYEFDVTCTIVDASNAEVAAPLISGESPFTLSDGESATLQVLDGASCSVAEQNTAGARVAIDDSQGEPADGIVTVEDTATVTVTNHFDPAGTTTTTTTTRPADVAGNLPATGTTIATILALAAVLVGVGVFLRGRRSSQ